MMSFARYTPMKRDSSIAHSRFEQKKEIVRYEGENSEPALKVVGE